MSIRLIAHIYDSSNGFSTIEIEGVTETDKQYKIPSRNFDYLRILRKSEIGIVLNGMLGARVMYLTEPDMRRFAREIIREYIKDSDFKLQQYVKANNRTINALSKYCDDLL